MNVRIDTLFDIYHIPRVKTLEELETTVFDYSTISQYLDEDRTNAMNILDKWINT